MAQPADTTRSCDIDLRRAIHLSASHAPILPVRQRSVLGYEQLALLHQGALRLVEGAHLPPFLPESVLELERPLICTETQPFVVLDLFLEALIRRCTGM